MPLHARALETIRRHGLAQAEDRVLVALSGGADSVALLFIMRGLHDAGQLTLAGAAHLNHRLRQEDADRDQAFCLDIAARLGIPIVTEAVDVAAVARASKRSLEDAARTVRYAFLERAADSLQADVIAVAHTREDQAETFLLRLLRGAGTRGLAAIQPRLGRVIRPLLEVSRAELREYLAGLGELFREDASNADVRIPRNRVRHELIPYLETHFSGGLTDVLSREAELARVDEAFLARQAIELTGRIVLEETGAAGGADEPSIRIDAAGLAAADRALSSRVAHTVLARLSGRAVEWQHVNRLLALAVEGPEGAAISLPGQVALRTGGTIVLRRGRTRGRHATNSFAFSLSIPGEVRSSANGWAISASHLDPSKWRLQKWQAKGPVVSVAASAVELPLAVRSRRPGDRLRPLGAPGARKLQDFMVDRKIAREDRDGTPLVVDAGDRIVWVVGHTIAEDFRVIDPAEGVLLLEVRRVGGAG
jgi:tRNA(Ile)-lysidine synthase